MSLMYTILMLTEHQNVQERVRNEVKAAMKKNGGKLSITALNNLFYLERCLKESLRLYPSIPLISRILSKDIKMPTQHGLILRWMTPRGLSPRVNIVLALLRQRYTVTNNLVPSGTIMQIHIHDIHRNPDFWPNPDVFDPDRFLPEKIQKRHPYSYLPFSAGPRNCIGQRFAMLELKAIMASLIHNFYLKPVDYIKDLRFMQDMVTRVAHPIRVRFVPIEHLQSEVNI
ncbi:PREDICTED: cytochrome P450 4C1-like [Wasmannia auropunctata]|uniref:cytochrome P450 4C1-like n=1 Tax=Wasmannia auropunctata TaxID=64793 RepID=UPI0005EF8C1E|nr:PREDICTED: cytochrome P450 4C1-like [Wasmannia auropunctata]XP_011701423.1 PREDICTED: cytochrome P450 4C1-like [Wasmannia auropunctata]